jgi:SulP family sulfate permease
VITDPAILSIRVDESLYFANARALEDAIYDRIADHPELHDVILMCPAVNAIDASALESLEAIAHRLGSAGIGFHLSEVKGPVMDALKRSDFMGHFKGQIFLSQYEAVRTLSTETDGGREVVMRTMSQKASILKQASPLAGAGSAG